MNPIDHPDTFRARTDQGISYPPPVPDLEPVTPEGAPMHPTDHPDASDHDPAPDSQPAPVRIESSPEQGGDRPASHRMDYPDAPRHDDCDILHGQPIRDPFRPLEDLGTPAARTWLAAQHRLTDAYVDTLPGRDRFRELLSATLVRGPTASPVKTAGTRGFRVGRERPGDPWQLQTRDDPDAAWRTVLRAHDLGARAALRRWQPSPDGRHIAVQLSHGGAETSTPLSVLDVDTAEITDTCASTRYSPVEWLADGSGFYYIRRHADRPGGGVYRHLLGTETSSDDLLTGDANPVGRYHIVLWHHRWLVITRRHGAGRATTVSVADITLDRPPRPLDLTGLSSTGVLIDAAGRILAVATEPTGFGQLLVAEPNESRWDPWRVLVPAAAPAVMGAVALTRVDGEQRMLILSTVDGCCALGIHDAETGERLAEAELPGAGTVAAIGPGDESGTAVLSYTDWVRPMSLWRLDIRSGHVTPADETATAVPDITVTRTTFRSGDGTEVPVTLLTPADAPKTPRPTILTCYGGFGISARPGFQPDGATWVLAGGTMAIAGVRGGGERGRHWHRDGAGPNKPNAFADLHAAGDWLVATGHTRRDQLALLGGSNGGLIATGAVVQRPGDYAAVVSASAPLDMVRYERWGLGRAWREEYGSADDPDALAVLLRYSPYHNAVARPGAAPGWPAALFTAGDSDTRVPHIHSCKMVALLQHGATGGPILLDVIAGKGHAGGEPDAQRSIVALLAFVARHTGMRFPPD